MARAAKWQIGMLITMICIFFTFVVASCGTDPNNVTRTPNPLPVQGQDYKTVCDNGNRLYFSLYGVSMMAVVPKDPSCQQ